MSADTAVQSDLEARTELEARVGQVWNTDELRADFEVIGFSYGVCSVRRRADGVKGFISFQHSPRFYYGFSASS